MVPAWMALPKNSTNITIRNTGSTIAMITVSSSRREIRRQRIESVKASDMDSLLFGFSVVGGVAREGEEDVVERGALEREALDVDAVGVNLVEQRPDLGGIAVRRDRQRELRAIVLGGTRAEDFRNRPE